MIKINKMWLNTFLIKIFVFKLKKKKIDIQNLTFLSPYLFLLCAEGLGTMIQLAGMRGDVHEVKVARGAPTITHQFYAC